MSVRKALSLWVSITLLYLPVYADEPKSFDESFNEVKDQASSGKTQSADKINTPKRIESSTAPVHEEDSNSTLLAPVLIGLCVGGVLLVRASSKSKS